MFCDKKLLYKNVKIFKKLIAVSWQPELNKVKAINNSFFNIRNSEFIAEKIRKTRFKSGLKDGGSMGSD